MVTIYLYLHLVVIKQYLKIHENKNEIFISVVTPYHTETYDTVSKSIPNCEKDNDRIRFSKGSIAFLSNTSEKMCGVGGDLVIFVQPDESIKRMIISPLLELSRTEVVIIN